MDKIYMFDVDGTLTPARQRMTEDFARFFDKPFEIISKAPLAVA